MKKIGLVFLILFTSCQNKTSKTCAITKPHEVVSIGTGSYTTKFSVWHSKDMHSYSLMLANHPIRISDGDIYTVLDFYSSSKKIIKQIDTNSVILEVIIFSDQVINNNSDLLKEHVKGFLLYYKKDKKLFSAVFRFSGKSLKYIEELNVQSRFISSNAIHLCAELFRTDVDQTISSIVFKSTSSTPEFYGKKGVDFANAIIKYSEDLSK